MERKECINHSHHGDRSEAARADAPDLVAEVEKADCEAAEDDGEVEP